jgi:hypothetical protein
MVVVNRDNKATYPIHIIVNFPYTNKYNNPIHQVKHNEQLNGLGINSLAFNHLDNIFSISVIIPDKSITKTIMQVNINNFNIIGSLSFD